MLNTSQAPRNNDRPSLDGYKRGASSSISRSHSASMLADWILLDGSKVSVSFIVNCFFVPQLRRNQFFLTVFIWQLEGGSMSFFGKL